MKPLALLFRSSLGRKYIMAISGIALVLFVLGHMLGNLLFFQGPDALNRYAYELQNLGGLLWVARIGLLVMVGLHIWAATVLTLANRRARPQGYRVKDNSDASFASRSMRWTGVILLLFIVYHILHYTALVIHPEYANMKTLIPGVVGEHHDVYKMVVAGFSTWWVAAFYIVSVGLLCLHLSHGVSSMFQSLGLRNERWRYRLDKIALAYGIIIFVGFAAVPVGVIAGVGN
jgi:succinate dehydrogenase / fumarate reductase cytochrome b subunit